MEINRILKNYFLKTTSTAVLSNYRMLFGILMLFSSLRFIAYGWVDKLYIDPSFSFSYLGFEWVKPLGYFTYVLFFLLVLFSVLIMLGYYYRIAMTGFFLVFTYVELMDKTTYLNHYYFVSCLSFMMIFIPLNYYQSMDVKTFRIPQVNRIPRFYVDVLKVMVSIVYLYAGLAKINFDWLFEALPLKIWLTNKYDIPLIGGLLEQSWIHYIFSWFGMLYDILIPFLLWNYRTRKLAFVAVVFFHVLTRILFPIGVFPWVMIATATIFFSEKWHLKLAGKMENMWKTTVQLPRKIKVHLPSRVILSVFLLLQIILPWRYLLYPGNIFWNEEGYRFSWRVMLMEKRGSAEFKVVNQETKEYFRIDNRDFLTSFQEKQMSTQPDMILEFAHYLGDHFYRQGHQNLAIYVDNYVSLNGKPTKLLIDNNTNLLMEKRGLQHKTWITSYEE